MHKIVAALVAALAIPFAAHAASPAPAAPVAQQASPYYASLKLGVYMPQADDLEGFDNGLAGDLQVGRRINPNFAAELGLGYFGTSVDLGGGDEINLSSIPLTVTAKGILPLQQGIELYGLGGVGMYVSTLEVKSSFVSGSDDETGFGFHLGAGGQFAVTPKLSLGLEARYVIAEVSDLNLDGFMLNGGVAFNF